SGTPMTSRVTEVLLYTSAPTGSRDRTACLASSPESTTRAAIPLRSSTVATARIDCVVASRENSACASSLGPSRDRARRRSVADGVSMSLAAGFGEALVDQGHGHGPLTDRGCASLDRCAPDVARGEQTGHIRLKRQWLTRQRPALERT